MIFLSVKEGIGKPTRLMHVGELMLPFRGLPNQRYGGLARTPIVHKPLKMRKNHELPV
jgi:hypothetical protein